MIKELLKLANHLDAKGLRKEADYLDSVIRKIAKPEYSDADGNPVEGEWLSEENNPPEMERLPDLKHAPHRLSPRGMRRRRQADKGNLVLEFLLFVDKTSDSQRNENIMRSILNLRDDTFQKNLIEEHTGRLIEGVKVGNAVKNFFHGGRAAMEDDKGIPVSVYLGPLSSGSPDILEERPVGHTMPFIKRILESAFEQKLGGVGLTLKERAWSRGTVSKP